MNTKKVSQEKSPINVAYIRSNNVHETRTTHAHLLGDDDEAACTTCYTVYFTNCEPHPHRMSTV